MAKMVLSKCKAGLIWDSDGNGKDDKQQ